MDQSLLMLGYITDYWFVYIYTILEYLYMKFSYVFGDNKNYDWKGTTALH
jgi:hypothetical protein